VKECFGLPAGDKLLVDHLGNEYNSFGNAWKIVGIQENKKLPITEMIKYIRTVKDKNLKAHATC
jgi:hypothetical protein